jgi:hypothetical protein
MEPSLRPGVTVRRVKMGDEEARSDREFWSAMPPAERVETAWQITLEVWRLKGWPVGQPGRHRSVERLIRR